MGVFARFSLSFLVEQLPVSLGVEVEEDLYKELLKTEIQVKEFS